MNETFFLKVKIVFRFKNDCESGPRCPIIKRHLKLVQAQMRNYRMRRLVEVDRHGSTRQTGISLKLENKNNKMDRWMTCDIRPF